MQGRPARSRAEADIGLEKEVILAIYKYKKIVK